MRSPSRMTMTFTTSRPRSPAWGRLNTRARRPAAAKAAACCSRVSAFATPSIETMWSPRWRAGSAGLSATIAPTAMPFASSIPNEVANRSRRRRRGSRQVRRGSRRRRFQHPASRSRHDGPLRRQLLLRVHAGDLERSRRRNRAHTRSRRAGAFQMGQEEVELLQPHMPTARAAKKWPSSCRTTSSMIPRIARAMASAVLLGRPRARAWRRSARRRPRPARAPRRRRGRLPRSARGARTGTSRRPLRRCRAGKAAGEGGVDAPTSSAAFRARGAVPPAIPGDAQARDSGTHLGVGLLEGQLHHSSQVQRRGLWRRPRSGRCGRRRSGRTCRDGPFVRARRRR